MSKNTKVKVDSPEYNKKTKKKFIIIMIVCFAIGGFGGFFGAAATDLFKGELADIGAWISAKLPYFQAYVMPWVILAFTLICFVLGEMWIKKAKKQIASWDGEDDEHIEVADTYLNKVGTSSNVLMISIQVLFGLATYQLLSTFKTTGNISMTMVSIVIYFAGLFIALSQQGRTVKIAKEYAPEKKGSIYDMKFQEVWYESCDEAERQLIGDVSYQTFRFMNSVFSAFETVTVIVGMFIPIGFLCAFFIGVLWLIMNCYYTHACTKLGQKK